MKPLYALFLRREFTAKPFTGSADCCRFLRTVLVAACALLTIAGVASAREYVIVPGDVLTITVAEDSSFNKTYTVDQNGNILLPLVGPFKAAGKTGAELQRELAGKDAIGKYVLNPTVTVQVSEPIGNEVRIYGEVLRPIMRVKDGTTLLDAIQAAGLSPNADTSKAIIWRAGATQPVGLGLDALLRGDLSKNFVLANGDIVYVPPKPPPGTIKVLGEVAKQGDVPFEPGMTVADAILKAGGFTESADRSKIEIVRKSGPPITVSMEGTEAIAGVSAGIGGALPLAEGDAVIVRDNRHLMFSITGGVRKGGQYPARKGMRLTDAIDMAGGLSEIAQLRSIVVVRGPQSPEPNKIIPVDFTKLAKGDISQNVEIQPGDSVFVGQESVRRAGGFRFGEVLARTVLSIATFGLLYR
ncbi:MAG: SLBB domain-containing protein [Armatimonadota bacterium]